MSNDRKFPFLLPVRDECAYWNDTVESGLLRPNPVSLETLALCFICGQLTIEAVHSL